MTKKKPTPLMNLSARNVAVNALLTFESNNTYIQDSLDKIFAAASLPDKERRLATELAYGVCRHAITLDYLIECCSNRSLPRIDPLIRQIIRVGLYQLIYLDRTPDFAAVDEAVRQADRAGLTGPSKFVNALLRAVQKRILLGPVPWDAMLASSSVLPIDADRGCRFKTAILPDPDQQPAQQISIALAHPLWLIDHWLKRYDRDTVRRICIANNTRPLLTLRPNTLRCTPEELALKLCSDHINVRRLSEAVQIMQPAIPQHLSGYEQGWFVVQDLTAMAVAPLLHPQPGSRVLDLCAAPGGKTTHLAELMNNSGTIIACDTHVEKLQLIEQNCQRLGISIVETIRAKRLAEYLQHAEPFDAVLLDAPCSNSGVMARRVEVRHTLKPKVLRSLTQIQRQLLQTAAQALKPAGKLLYSTCSIEPVENELLIERFLADTAGFTVQSQNLTLPSFQADGGYTALLIHTR